jgi:hypothetical protein
MPTPATLLVDDDGWLVFENVAVETPVTNKGEVVVELSTSKRELFLLLNRQTALGLAESLITALRTGKVAD